MEMKLKLSKTGEGELLIHKEDGKGGFINIIINVSDIEIMPKEKIHGISLIDAIDFWNKN